MFLPFAAVVMAGIMACASPSPERRREASSRMQMGMTYLEQRNIPSAMRELTKAAELDPENPEIDMALGLAYQARGDMGKAEEYFRRAIGKKSDYAEAHNNLGIVLSQQGKGDEAIREFEMAASNVLYPTPEWAYFNMGEEYRHRNNPEKAEEMYRRSIRMNDRYVDAYLRLAYMQADRGKTGDAAKTLEACVAVVPGAARAWLDLGRIYVSQGKRQDAQNAFRAALANSTEPALRKEASEYLDDAGKEKR
jgi:type IV pilus biogenesis/stability protein PilW